MWKQDAQANKGVLFSRRYNYGFGMIYAFVNKESQNIYNHDQNKLENKIVKLKISMI